jgi:type II restriction enzyme
VADFRCDECEEQYQVKAKKKTLGRSVTDGEFNKMQEAINKCKIPNFFFINYLPDYSCITNLVLVPKEFILPDVIVPRRPLGPTARRASWQGCNIRIDRIPDAGKVFVVRDSQAIAKDEVLNNVKKISFFRQTQDMKQRNWLSDVLLVVSWIKSPEFRLVDVYQFAPVLQARHPGNHHIKDKIRQQLQVLRNCGMLEFTSRGKYRKL